MQLNTKIPDLKQFIKGIHNELFNNILPFWINHTPDEINGGFYGRITNDNTPVQKAEKCLILYTRILWTFSAVYNYRPSKIYLDMAERAYCYLIEKFSDKIHGGMFWLLDHTGKPVDSAKKIYGQAFSIYALSEYYKINHDIAALNLAKDIFNLIENHNYDNKNTGYFEVSNQDWTIAHHIALSDVDMIEKKSMNTHLHLLEAYSNLFKVWPNSNVKKKLVQLIKNFTREIIDHNNYHMKLFFDENWHPKSESSSFGHDIEASWLLTEAVDLLDNEPQESEMNNISLKMVEATINEGFDESFVIYSEKKGDGTINKCLEWWQQAEAVVGLINAYQISSDRKYLDIAMRCWNVIEQYIIDKENGEWFNTLLPDHSPDLKSYKVSEWKGPYHNTRTCLETLRRIEII